MSIRRPEHQPWHDLIDATCDCGLAWSGRGLVDDGCYFHAVVNAAEELIASGWTMIPPGPGQTALELPL
jgi:hypothetical protein